MFLKQCNQYSFSILNKYQERIKMTDCKKYLLYKAIISIKRYKKKCVIYFNLNISQESCLYIDKCYRI